MEKLFLAFILLASKNLFIIANNEMTHSESSSNTNEDYTDVVKEKCNSMANKTALKYPYDCLTNSTSYKENSGIEISTVEENECCFFQRNFNTTSSYNIGYCDIAPMKQNGTIVYKNEFNYTTICSPFNQTKYELQRLKDYNEPLIPCATDVDIESSQDCYDKGDDTKFCCHVFGYVEGSSISQCYYFNKSVSNRKGTYIDRGLTFACGLSKTVIEYILYIVIFLFLL